MRIYSFGYKLNGEDQFAVTGPNAPRIFDCRGLYNPHSDAKLRRMTGRDKEVQDAVAASPGAGVILTEAHNYMMQSGNHSVAFGCSYGKHRSVALAEMLAARLPDAMVIHTGAVSR